jgi:uncharacterized repeat protein (TIGR03803 family)
MISRLSLIFALLLLAFTWGCGGGSGGGGSVVGPYTIGGTITGLAGTVVLQNNGGYNLSLNANGSFLFNTTVAGGATYDVTIAVQPSAPVQFCSTSNDQGTANANVTDVQVTCSTPTEQTVFNFLPPGVPQGTLIFDNFGNMYGTTSGGLSGSGTVFELTPNNGQWTETTLYTFCQLTNCTDGARPAQGLVADSAGNLYGTTNSGGAYGSGIVFELSASGNGTWTETVLHSFGSGIDGAGFLSALVFDPSGNLYGTTGSGGSSGNCTGGCGAVFELSPNSGGAWTEKVIWSFSFTDGAGPSGVVIDGAGNLYGAAGGGNSTGDGTVFELSPSTNGQWNLSPLHDFQNSPTDGAGPQSGVVLDASGNLFGTTAYGYAGNHGTVYEVTKGVGGLWQERTLYGFCALSFCADGSTPNAPLIIDKAGNLYGTTSSGGLFQTWGVVFALARGSSQSFLWAESPLYSFQGPPDGGTPYSGLTMDAQGNLYGVAPDGANETGVLFKVTP